MSRIKKIVFIIESPFNLRDYKRFGVELLQNSGLEVEVWDVTPILHPDVFNKVCVHDPIQYSGHCQLFTKRTISSEMSQLDNSCFIICLVGYQFESLFLYRLMTKYNLDYAVFMGNAIPEPVTSMQTNMILARLKRLTLSKLLKVLHARLPYKYCGVKPASVVLAGGSKSINTNYPTSDLTDILWMHSMDYDIYLEKRSGAIEYNPQRAVFLDEYVPFHPDYIHMGVSPYVEPGEYYELLRRYFNYLENQHHIDVVVAAHPRSKYEDHPDYYGGRPVIRGETVDLIRSAQFIIAHSSTAINYGILFNKPIIVITTDKLKASIQGPYIEAMASALGKKPFNLNDGIEMNLEEELLICDGMYAEYRESYIKKEGTKEMPFWQIFADSINASC